MEIETAIVNSVADAMEWTRQVGFPVMVHALYTNWTERAADVHELEQRVILAIGMSPVKAARLKPLV